MAGSIHCPACGARVELPGDGDAEVTVTRDGVDTSTPGRATITVAGETVHRCAGGRFLPPDRHY
jgi:hypothetical protein